MMIRNLKKRWLAWLRPDSHGIQSGDTLSLSSGDIVVSDGAKLDIYDAAMVKRKRTVKVTSHTRTTLTIRRLRWYEALWDRLHFYPKTDYRHRSGVLKISQVYSQHCYCDAVTVVPNTRFGRLVKRFYAFIFRHQQWIAEYDAASLDLDNRDGYFFPRFSGSYWWFMPIRFANRFFPRVNGTEAREWPDEIR